MEDFRDMPHMRSAAVPPRRMRWVHNEPHLNDMLADPITQMLMRRDGVQEAEIRHLVERLRRRRKGAAGND
ncbi:MAG TPA: hypothetical protein VF194_17940 [Ferrovibrio sp.]|uniref:hypothetical protein n=1 Tax=Ferrovibrio sp. TaxID=1917215 RepID=UPI002ED57E55